jgi:uncharacterized membrane protein
METALLSTDGFLFILRWLHFFAGITWIGHLYYFNFTQGPFFNETDAATKSGAIQKLVPRELWWFRWGAMYTIITGLLILAIRGHESGFGIFATSWGVTILTGFALGIVMWFNVWFIIWPAQKIVIQNAIDTAAGKPANPAAATRGARSGVASRFNTLFSIPLLFIMGAASHLPLTITENAQFGLLAGVVIVLIGAMEFVALTRPMPKRVASVKGVIHSGFALSVVMYVILEVLT